MATISRRKLAQHVSRRLLAGDASSDVVKELAAYLVVTRRTKELALIVRDIEASLAAHGTVVAHVTYARPLEQEATNAIVDYIKTLRSESTDVILKQTIDESVIGGVKIDVPGAQLDATIKTTLDRLTYQ